MDEIRVYNNLVKVVLTQHFKDRFSERVDKDLSLENIIYTLDSVAEKVYLKRSGDFHVYLSRFRHTICVFWDAIKKIVRIKTILPENCWMKSKELRLALSKNYNSVGIIV